MDAWMGLGWIGRWMDGKMELLGYIVDGWIEAWIYLGLDGENERKELELCV